MSPPLDRAVWVGCRPLDIPANRPVPLRLSLRTRTPKISAGTDRNRRSPVVFAGEAGHQARDLCVFSVEAEVFSRLEFLACELGEVWIGCAHGDGNPSSLEPLCPVLLTHLKPPLVNHRFMRIRPVAAPATPRPGFGRADGRPVQRRLVERGRRAALWRYRNAPSRRRQADHRRPRSCRHRRRD